MDASSASDALITAARITASELKSNTSAVTVVKYEHATVFMIPNVRRSISILPERSQRRRKSDLRMFLNSIDINRRRDKYADRKLGKTDH